MSAIDLEAIRRRDAEVQTICAECQYVDGGRHLSVEECEATTVVCPDPTDHHPFVPTVANEAERDRRALLAWIDGLFETMTAEPPRYGMVVERCWIQSPTAFVESFVDAKLRQLEVDNR